MSPLETPAITYEGITNPERLDATSRRGFMQLLVAAPFLLSDLLLNKEGGAEEPIQSEDILPSALKELPADHPLRTSWNMTKKRLESILLGDKPERHSVDTYQSIGWNITQEGIKKLRAMDEDTPIKNNTTYSVKVIDPTEHLWVQLSSDEARNGKRCIDVTLKIGKEREICYQCNDKDECISEESSVPTPIEPLGNIAFEIIDANGKVIAKGQTSVRTGIGSVNIPDQSPYPWKVRFTKAEGVATPLEKPKGGKIHTLSSNEVTIG